MAINIETKTLNPVRRDGQIDSVIIANNLIGSKSFTGASGSSGTSGTSGSSGSSGISGISGYTNNNLYWTGNTLFTPYIVTTGATFTSGDVNFNAGFKSYTTSYFYNTISVRSTGNDGAGSKAVLMSTSLNIGGTGDTDGSFVIASSSDGSYGATSAAHRLEMRAYGTNATINPHSGPLILTRNTSNQSVGLIGFQDKTSFTDGTVTMYSPVVFNSGLTISGGTIVFTDTVWDDILIGPMALGLGASAPALVDYTPSGSSITIKALEFAKNDIAYFQCQLPHGYKVGTNVYGHVHWNPRDYGVAQSGATVGWKINYTIAGINGIFEPIGTLDLSDTCDGTNDKHQMTPDLSIGSGSTVSAIIMGSVTRTDTGTDDTWGETLSGRLPLLLGIDFHYEIDTVGSRERLSK